MSLMTLDKVSYRYDKATRSTLQDINAEFESGKIYAVVGKSGSGKSTLLSLIAGLDICSQGRIYYKEKDLSTMNRDEYRARNIGVIFQDYNLLTNATAIDNVVLSMEISGVKERNKKSKAYEILQKVGIDQETAKRKVRKLSGGEQQRIGIASAISHESEMILADEPTSNLDQDTEKEIMDILTDLAHKEGKCVIIVTHSKKVSSYADEVWRMNQGKIVLTQ